MAKMKYLTVTKVFFALVSFLSLLGCTNVSVLDNTPDDNIEATLPPISNLTVTPAPVMTSTPVLMVPVTSYPDPLDGSSWELISFEGDENSPSIPEQHPFLLHFKGGGLSFQGGCNSLSGHYVLEYERITITFSIRTEVECTPPIINAVEMAIFDAMSTFASYAFEGDGILRIRYTDGEFLLHRIEE